MMKSRQKRALIVVDLTAGDAGKGSTVDFLSRQFDSATVIRFNGGAQAAHNVITPDGRHHTFAQFGSGLFVPGTLTCLSKYMILDPLAMRSEARHLKAVGVPDAFERTYIDQRALVTTPYHQTANQYRELARGDARHGSCGMGIGETVADFLANADDALFAGDLLLPQAIRRKLSRIRAHLYSQLQSIETQKQTSDMHDLLQTFEDEDLIEACVDVYTDFAEQIEILSPDVIQTRLQHAETLIFEGAQGVLLDEWYGFHPYTTWSTTTFHNALQILDETNIRDVQVTRIGVVRAYGTRHGAGPFVTQDAQLTQLIPDMHNTMNPWQREFRIGYFDAVTTRYALQVVGGIDTLTITNLDRLTMMPEWQVCDAYTYQKHDTELGRFFTHDQNTIAAIRVNHAHDLRHQQQLGTHLLQCKPQYQSLASDDVEEYIDWIASVTGTTPGLLSYGPTAADKTETLDWQRLLATTS